MPDAAANKTLIGIEPALIEWRDEFPFSSTFDDVYFSADDGAAETEYVFLAGNQLAERWQSGEYAEQHFVIAETGFGTGLNILLAWQLWTQTRSHVNAPRHLHCVSIEKHPLVKSDLKLALQAITQRWPNLSPYAQRLQDAYPPLMPGRYRLYLDEYTTLTLIFADIQAALPELNANVDAWFLDGFAPSKNTDMWQATMYQSLRRWSSPSATLATFTAAGHVRRGLQAAGFAVQKQAGFGRKRDMLIGRLDWVGLPGSPTVCGQMSLPKSALIIGAGLAGAGAAAALARYGVACTVVDANPQPAAAGSGVPAAAVRPYFDSLWQTASRLYTPGFAFTAQHPKCDYERIGVLKVANVEAETLRQQRLRKNLRIPDDFLQFVDAKQASELLGIPCDYAGYWLPDGGWCQPAKLVEALLGHPLIDSRLGVTVASIQTAGQGWVAINTVDETVAAADVVVLATGAADHLLPSFLSEALRPIRGQVERVLVEESDPLASNRPMLRTAFNHRGYAIATGDRAVCVGASFVSGVSDTRPSEAERAENFAKLADALPDLALTAQRGLQSNSWVGIRAKCAGHLPMIGALDRFASTHRFDCTHLPWHVSTAHGARGLCSALLAGEQLASEILGLPLAFDSQVKKVCLPSRFNRKAQ